VNENNVSVLADGKAYKFVVILGKTVEQYYEHRKKLRRI